MGDHKQNEQLIRDTLTQARSSQMKILFYGGFFASMMLLADYLKGPNDNTPYKKFAMAAIGATWLGITYTEHQKDKLRRYLPQGEPPQPPRR